MGPKRPESAANGSSSLLVDQSPEANGPDSPIVPVEPIVDPRAYNVARERDALCNESTGVRGSRICCERFRKS